MRWLLAGALSALPVLGFACKGGEVARPIGPPVPGSVGGGGEAGDAPDAALDAPCTQIPMPDGAPITVTGTVVELASDGGVAKTIADAMVAAEYGGLYVPWCDLAHASPYYIYGAYTDAKGDFSIDVREGFLGFHSFATGYLYTRAALHTGDGGTVTLQMEQIKAGQQKPLVSGAAFDKTTVAPGGALTFSATVKAAVSTDPLSDELILVEPSRSWATELDPPSVGLKDDFPDGLWTKTFLAPTTKGTYTYYFSATTSLCVTSDVQPFTITVQ